MSKLSAVESAALRWWKYRGCLVHGKSKWKQLPSDILDNAIAALVAARKVNK